MTKTLFISVVILTFLLFAGPDSVLADAAGEIIEAPEDLKNLKSCIGTRSIKKTKILSDRSILFYARGKKVYQNTLPKKCSGLNKNSIISYTLTTSRLCQHDHITILRDLGRRTLSPGISCGLGKFEPVPNIEALQGLE